MSQFSSWTVRECRPLFLAGALLLGTLDAHAVLEGGAGELRIRPNRVAEDTCRVIREEAERRGLPPPFFARLIWKESAFSPSAVSPKGARGIAQFMGATAAERGLDDPFDPAPALAASAHYLADLQSEFGSLGLAAAAYNAGPARVRAWLAGDGGLPRETEDYVHWITGHPAADWRETKKKFDLLPIAAKLSFGEACLKLALRALSPRAPAGWSAGRTGGKGSGTAGPGIKRVEASAPGRVKFVIQLGERPAAKAEGRKRKRR